MMSRNTYKSGQWNVTCDVCSKKIKAEDAKQRWDGFIVCPDDFEERQPQDFVRARQDKISVPFTRPIPPFVFTNVVYVCTPEGSSAYAGKATAGCSISGRTSI